VYSDHLYRAKDKPYLENLTCLLETQLPRPTDGQTNNQQVECGICYAQCLPVGIAIYIFLDFLPYYVFVHTSFTFAILL